MDTPYTSLELFHFVGWRHPEDDERNFHVLAKILAAGSVSAPPHREDYGHIEYEINMDHSLLNEELIVPSMTCFADIPRESLGILTRKYGRFGLALSRDFLVFVGARPVMYFPVSHNHGISIYGEMKLREIEATYKGFHRVFSEKFEHFAEESERSYGDEPDTIDQAIEGISDVFAMDFLAYIKPFNADLPMDHRDSYYMEREWMRLGNVKFQPANVRRIVVAAGYAERLIKRCPDYAERIFPLP